MNQAGECLAKSRCLYTMTATAFLAKIRSLPNLAVAAHAFGPFREGSMGLMHGVNDRWKCVFAYVYIDSE